MAHLVFALFCIILATHFDFLIRVHHSLINQLNICVICRAHSEIVDKIVIS